VGRFGEELEQRSRRVLWGGLGKSWSRGHGGFCGEVYGRVGAEDREGFLGRFTEEVERWRRQFLKREMKREEGSVMNGKCPTRASA